MSKLDAARWQLDRAIELFLDEGDFICAITLAGAAEEILGKLLNDAQQSNALNQFLDLCMFVQKADADEVDSPRAKDFIALANAQRDALKHVTDRGDVAIDEKDAIELLDRSIANFMSLTGRDTPPILRYMAEARVAQART